MRVAARDRLRHCTFAHTSSVEPLLDSYEQCVPHIVHCMLVRLISRTDKVYIRELSAGGRQAHRASAASAHDKLAAKHDPGWRECARVQACTGRAAGRYRGEGDRGGTSRVSGEEGMTLRLHSIICLYCAIDLSMPGLPLPVTVCRRVQRMYARAQTA